MVGGCPFIFKSLSLLVLCIMVKRALARIHKSCGSTLDLSDSHISLAVLLAKLRIITHSGYYTIPYSVIKAIGDSTAGRPVHGELMMRWISMNSDIPEADDFNLGIYVINEPEGYQSPLVTLAFCLHLEAAQVGISWNFLQENA